MKKLKTEVGQQFIENMIMSLLPVAKYQVKIRNTKYEIRYSCYLRQAGFNSPCFSLMPNADWRMKKWEFVEHMNLESTRIKVSFLVSRLLLLQNWLWPIFGQRSTVHSRQQIVVQWILASQLKYAFNSRLQFTVVHGLWTVDITFAITFGNSSFPDSS